MGDVYSADAKLMLAKVFSANYFADLAGIYFAFFTFYTNCLCKLVLIPSTALTSLSSSINYTVGSSSNSA